MNTFDYIFAFEREKERERERGVKLLVIFDVKQDVITFRV